MHWNLIVDKVSLMACRAKTRRSQALSYFRNRLVKSILAFSSLLFVGSFLPYYGQDSDMGRRIYAEDAQSVLLLFAQSPSGEFVAQGSGFVIDGGRIVTNAHVANAGKIFLDLGPARVATHVEKIDDINDLAILRVDIQLTVKPLVLSHGTVATGITVYAIGNPEGLEKTISQGVVSGQREVEGRQLLQITAPISHGSSGGADFELVWPGYRRRRLKPDFWSESQLCGSCLRARECLIWS